MLMLGGWNGKKRLEYKMKVEHKKQFGGAVLSPNGLNVAKSAK